RRREAAEREKLAFQHAATSALAAEAEAAPAAEAGQAATPQTFTREAPKVGRNDPCPCGSGKKYKQCHGAL
ncbi:MAG: SEC-C metal-binding domain-containing protein, partial [Chromatocurvus sp.]